MSLTSSKVTNFVGTATRTVMDNQICPRCKQKMRVEILAPTMFLGDHDQITYVCKQCGSEDLHTLRT